MQSDPTNTTQTKTSELHQHHDFIESVELAYFLGVLTKKEYYDLLKGV